MSPWFRDGDKGSYDYYNAWGFYYALYWLNIINPERYSEFYKVNLCLFIGSYKSLIHNGTFPFFGRSACYKYAVTVPLLLSSLNNKSQESKFDSLREFNQIWNHYSIFEENKNKLLSQGLFGDQEEWFDNYSGPGSSLWSLRSAIVLMYNNKEFDVNFNSNVLARSLSNNINFDYPIIVDNCGMKIEAINNLIKVSFFNRDKCNETFNVEKLSLLRRLKGFISLLKG
ncbi:DUF2264 domain-containing protein [Vibrio breoganii]